MAAVQKAKPAAKTAVAAKKPAAKTATPEKEPVVQIKTVPTPLAPTSVRPAATWPFPTPGINKPN